MKTLAYCREKEFEYHGDDDDCDDDDDDNDDDDNNNNNNNNNKGTCILTRMLTARLFTYVTLYHNTVNI